MDSVTWYNPTAGIILELRTGVRSLACIINPDEINLCKIMGEIISMTEDPGHLGKLVMRLHHILKSNGNTININNSYVSEETIDSIVEHLLESETIDIWME